MPFLKLTDTFAIHFSGIFHKLVANVLVNFGYVAYYFSPFFSLDIRTFHKSIPTLGKYGLTNRRIRMYTHMQNMNILNVTARVHIITPRRVNE